MKKVFHLTLTTLLVFSLFLSGCRDTTDTESSFSTDTGKTPISNENVDSDLQSKGTVTSNEDSASNSQNTVTNTPEKENSSTSSSSKKSTSSSSKTSKPSDADSKNDAPTESSNPASDFEYKVLFDGSVSITKYIGDSTEVVIPTKINGKTVTEIGEHAFANKMKITSVVIPDTVIVIGGGAFTQCISLNKIAIPDSVTEISGGAFYECKKLSDVTIPKNLKKMGHNAFAYCESIKKVTIPKTLTEWGDCTFQFTGIEELKIENGVKKISYQTFSNTKISTVTIPKSVTVISAGAFGECNNLEKVILNDGLVTIDEFAFAGKSKLTEVIIPKTVKNITERAFSGCMTLNKVKFEGDAPEIYLNPQLSPKDEEEYIICYHNGAKGFTSPEWNGYKTEIW